MAARRLSPLPEVHGRVLENADQLGLGLLGAHAHPGVAGGEPVAAAPEGAGDLAYVYRLGAQGAFRALGDLPQVGHHVDALDAAELVDCLLGIELAGTGARVIVVVYGGDQDLPVADGVRERHADYLELLEAPAAVDLLVDLGRDDPGAQEVGDELVGPGRDVAEVEPAGVRLDADVDRLCGLPVDLDAELAVQARDDLGRGRGAGVDVVVLGVERVVLVVVGVPPRPGSGGGGPRRGAPRGGRGRGRGAGVDVVVLGVERVVLVVVEVQPRPGFGDGDAGPVCTRGVHDQEVVAGRQLGQRLLRQ